VLRIKRFPNLPQADLAEWLIRNYNVMDVAFTAACFLLESQQVEKVVLTQEQFVKFFKVRGLREDGMEETRGRRSLAERLAAARLDRAERVKMIDNSNNDTKDTGED
jgi:hypothetical protein